MDEEFLVKFGYLPIEQGILSTLSFFSLYQVPLSADKLLFYLYKSTSCQKEFDKILKKLVDEGKVFQKEGLYSLAPWRESLQITHAEEIKKRRKKVQNFLWLFGFVPFAREVSLINSVVMGNCTKNSDIDFFVITAPGKLYFVRTVIYGLFKLFGLYKTQTRVSERFCFGYYVTEGDLSLEKTLIKGEDPVLAFWLASMLPLFGKKHYVNLIKANQWVFKYLPNFTPTPYFYGLIKKPFSLYARPFLEVLFFLPALLLEPIFRRIHIRHTFNLPENHWPTATTVATANMLKLHALDPREKIRDDFTAKTRVLLSENLI